MVDDTESGTSRRLSLGTRIFLAMALLIALAVGAAVAVTGFLGRGIAYQAVEDDIGRGGAVLSALQEQRLDQLSLVAELMARDPYFTAYIAEGFAADDSFSITDQLEERIRGFELDFAIVVDPDGAVFADTFATNVALGTDDPLIATLLEDYAVGGIWPHDDSLFYLVGAPLEVAGVLQGFLLTGEVIDDNEAQEMRRVTETEVVFFTADDQPALVAGTLDAAATEELAQAFRAPADGETSQVMAAEVDGKQWLAQVRPLLGVDGGTTGWSVSLGSLAEALAPYRRIGFILLGVGLLVIGVGALLSGLLTKPVLGPVRQLAEVAAKASEGDYDQEILTQSSGDVGKLASAFSRLLVELREKRDMEIYVAELNRNMPVASAAPVARTAAAGYTRAEPPRARDAVTLGVELRDLPVGNSDQATIDELERRLRRVADAVTLQQGAVGTLAGHRLLAIFEGGEPLGRALGSTDLVMRADGASAVVITAGQVVTGAVTLGDLPRQAITGGAVGQLERLLRTADAGNLLLDRTVFSMLEALAAAAGIPLTALTDYDSRLPVYSLDRDMATRLAVAAEADATLVATSPGSISPRPSTLPRALATRGDHGPGTVLAERFEIEGVLGSGGMGVVYRAFDRQLDEIVAIKMLKGDAISDPEQVSRLRSELKLARKISHPNVLRTYDFGEVDGVPFISMELVRGITLRQLLQQRDRMPIAAGLRLARQLCRGLMAAHGQSVLHRDIKPENLIIEANGNLKLMDFGIARPVHRMEKGETKTGAIVGTPYYLAPEQLAGQEVDVRTDIYACGVVLYELFTGTAPFADSPTAIQMMLKKTQEDPPSPRTFWAQLPSNLETILLRCVSRDPAGRYPDVATLLDALDRCRA
ncbi:MAG: protein kinase [Acidobacteriota bacterium]